jgi:hypothetical protein
MNMKEPGNVNLYAAWIGMLLGCVSGAAQGLFFHREQWLGGYGSWCRRMIRLGHISFFGIAFLNLAFAVTIFILDDSGLIWASRLLIAGAIGMPLFCYLSAFREGFRHGFALPVLCLTAAIAIVVGRLL